MILVVEINETSSRRSPFTLSSQEVFDRTMSPIVSSHRISITPTILIDLDQEAIHENAPFFVEIETSDPDGSLVY
ncbi:hypothetical protein TPY_0521 [Sulfobacillus acidophilus TPY]|nr:hypothetical protein TPY_0521 [Sulfobacillus acidophilus TPY]